jgi:hypothetical protein
MSGQVFCVSLRLLRQTLFLFVATSVGGFVVQICVGTSAVGAFLSCWRDATSAAGS